MSKIALTPASVGDGVRENEISDMSSTKPWTFRVLIQPVVMNNARSICDGVLGVVI